MKALILAGGFGTRLRSVAGDVPKPMVLIAGKPFLEHQLRFLNDHGITEVIIAVHHRADHIKSYFGNGLRWGVDITYSEEETPLGTAGAIKKAEKYLNDTFIVLNGDTYAHLDLKQFIDFHKSKRSLATLAITKSTDPSHYGNVSIHENKIVEFTEKKEGNESYISGGVYIFEPKILDYIKSEENVSLEKEVFPKLAQENLLWAYIYDGYSMDIGRPETYTQFKKDVMGTLLLREHHKVRDAMMKISKSGINLVLITDEQKRLLGVANDRIIKEYILQGGNLDDVLLKAMIRDPITAKTTDDRTKIDELLHSGINHLPILDEQGRISDIEFRVEKIKTESFPAVRGKSPLRISFAGGGTDLEHFFKKHGGVVISATIDKYCYGTMVKRADSKIIVHAESGQEVILDAQKKSAYNGEFDLVKAIINIMKPNFGFELYFHNDLPPGRGLGSSATYSVLIISLLDHMMDLHYDDYKIAEVAYKAEREELNIKGGWQDQYAAVTGGFNFMEFNEEKTVIYPLRLKEQAVHELNEHLLLCYVGQSHSSNHQHQVQEKIFQQDEQEIVRIQNDHKKIAIELKDALLRNELESIGRLLRDSWEIKKKLSNTMSNHKIDLLYDTGLKNGAFGGRLLGSGGGGYILFFFAPKKRNQLVKSLQAAGGEVSGFNFEFSGTKIWPIKIR